MYIWFNYKHVTTIQKKKKQYSAVQKYKLQLFSKYTINEKTPKTKNNLSGRFNGNIGLRLVILRISRMLPPINNFVLSTIVGKSVTYLSLFSITHTVLSIKTKIKMKINKISFIYLVASM